jgi:hypothetical protein
LLAAHEKTTGDGTCFCCRAKAGEARNRQILAKRPEWANAVIVAELKINQSDSQTDHFGHTIGRRCVIGWRKSKRESFKALRKAAGQFEETKHLGPGIDEHKVTLVWDHDYKDTEAQKKAFLDYRQTYYKGWYLPCHFCDDTPNGWPVFDTAAEAQAFCDEHPAPAGTEWRVEFKSIEHRDNYSMGQGNYLGGWHGGWAVHSESFKYGDNPLGSSRYEDCLPA